MMKFEDLMEKYFSSGEITRIPDRWSEYVPVMFIRERCWCVLLLYFIESEKSELKQATFISGEDGSIEVLSQNDLKGKYNITQFIYESDAVQSDAYFEAKDEYVDLLKKSFDKLQSNEKLEMEIISRLEHLISVIIPVSILDGVYRKICGDGWKNFEYGI